jgi:hypothetical protein
MNRRTTALLTLVVGGGIVLGACGTGGSSWTVPSLAKDSETANVDLINGFDCTQTQTALAQMATAVNEHDLEKQSALGLTDDNKDAISTALTEHEEKCADAPAADPNAALKSQAKEICGGDGTVADCKKRGTAALEAIPAEKRGDPKKPNDPVSVHNALTTLPDKPESLRDAAGYAGQLAKLEQFLKEGASVDNAANAAALYSIFSPDTNQADVNVGSEGDHAVDWALNTQEERGSGSFAKKTLKTQADIQEFLNGDSAESVVSREGVTKAIRDAGYGDDEVARALRGEGYIPIQLKGASQILGTSYYQNGKVLVLGKWRQAAEGDVYWLYFASDGKLIRDALLRADCGNMGATMIRVVRSGMPPAPSVDQPPNEEKCPPGTIIDHETGFCGPPPPGGCKDANNCQPVKECKPPLHGHWPNCKDDDSNLTTYGPGPGTNIDPGPGAYVEPGNMEQPPATTRVNPPPVTTTKPAPPPVVQPTVIPTQPTVQPSTQPTKTGTLPGDPGCGNPELC